jgi:hypothetical protein
MKPVRKKKMMGPKKDLRNQMHRVLHKECKSQTRRRLSPSAKALAEIWIWFPENDISY